MSELKEGEAIERDDTTLLQAFIGALQAIANNYPDDVVEAFASVRGADGEREFFILREDSYEMCRHDVGHKVKQEMKMHRSKWLNDHNCEEEVAYRKGFKA